MAAHRFDSIDALRGAAIVWMTVFHFCYDLNHFGWMRQNFHADPFWTWQRSAIVGLFLFCAGLGQAMAVAQGQSWPRFWRRWGQIAACALLVSLGSYWMFPRSFIYFGVLHGIVVMLIVVRLSARWGRWLWPAGALAMGLPMLAAAAHTWQPGLAFLNEPVWNWLGWISKKPVTEDYVPIFPWLGLMWWGMAAGQRLLIRPASTLARPLPPAMAPLAWLGRWSLSWYMLHQPVLMGLLMGVAAIQAG